MAKRHRTAKERREHRERAAAAELGRARAAHDQAVRAGWCFAAELDPQGCSEKIINAHAVQRGGVLDRVADGGHVLAWQKDRDDDYDFRPLGINKASTFPGFCSRHDNDVFRPLDRYPFVATHEQAFLLCLRALAHECHKKTTQIAASGHYEEAFASDSGFAVMPHVILA